MDGELANNIHASRALLTSQTISPGPPPSILSGIGFIPMIYSLPWIHMFP